MADIFGVRVAPDLSVLDSLIIICNDAGGQTDPSVVFNGENYIVVWADAFAGVRDIALKALRVDPQGNVIGNGVRFGSGNSVTDIAFDGDRCLVIWAKAHQGVFGRFLNDQALPEDSVFRIDTIIGSEVLSHLAYDGTNYLVVWSDFDSLGNERDVFGRLVSPDGWVVSDRIAITCTTGHQVNPDVSFNGENYLVAWVEASGVIKGRFIGLAGQLVSEIFPVSDTTPYVRDNVQSAVGSTNHLIVWSEWHADFDIYGNGDLAIKVEEGESPELGAPWSATIISGPFVYDRTMWDVFDVSGRQVSGQVFAKGVYFLRDRSGSVHKIVKVR
ncbi:hypothetical protein JXB22_05220 [candidate division WOR-3 bacterium]|nr:hypothetical protein [candidate division WOR-3 bacterium]